MSHPLTNEMIEQNSPLHIRYLSEGERYFATEAARWGATWQLERDAEELKIILYRIRLLQPIAIDALVEEFKKAMRPQEDD